MAQLNGYRLGFYKQTGESNGWNGACATIFDDKNGTVSGAVYELDLKHLPSLDDQEGVNKNIYAPLVKEVITSDGKVLECRTYQMSGAPTDELNLSDPNIPFERKPSKTYMDVILRGSEESQLPQEYQNFLRNIVHNGNLASQELLDKLFGNY
ncbi:gamma-glutamylcyclotransferase-like [Sitodiplosis mosellana]|uniref:gamma-glutamylcyclotransferase-like n=1 Tax=Sitodiplosis mosellana TaxID=263140 RepID=UPI0024448694|nr:gamma-glutamylcyclotransferase-like [Sitodiplosis mosellana]XP_055315982.1 gamma-glutamylcyclotransferase-like [Sitodiplosis mosellana]